MHEWTHTDRQKDRHTKIDSHTQTHWQIDKHRQAHTYEQAFGIWYFVVVYLKTNTNTSIKKLGQDREFIITGLCNGQCSFPEDLRGTWYSSDKGTVVFTSNTLQQYSMPIAVNIQAVDLNCVLKRGDKYVLQ